MVAPIKMQVLIKMRFRVALRLSWIMSAQCGFRSADRPFFEQQEFSNFCKQTKGSVLGLRTCIRARLMQVLVPRVTRPQAAFVISRIQISIREENEKRGLGNLYCHFKFQHPARIFFFFKIRTNITWCLVQDISNHFIAAHPTFQLSFIALHFTAIVTVLEPSSSFAARISSTMIVQLPTPGRILQSLLLTYRTGLHCPWWYRSLHPLPCPRVGSSLWAHGSSLFLLSPTLPLRIRLSHAGF